MESLKGWGDFEGLKGLDAFNEYYDLDSLTSLKLKPKNSRIF